MDKADLWASVIQNETKSVHSLVHGLRLMNFDWNILSRESFCHQFRLFKKNFYAFLSRSLPPFVPLNGRNSIVSLEPMPIYGLSLSMTMIVKKSRRDWCRHITSSCLQLECIYIGGNVK